MANDAVLRVAESIIGATLLAAVMSAVAVVLLLVLHSLYFLYCLCYWLLMPLPLRRMWAGGGVELEENKLPSAVPFVVTTAVLASLAAMMIG